MEADRVCGLGCGGLWDGMSRPKSGLGGRGLHGMKRIRAMSEDNLLTRITINPEIFGGKPIIRGRRLAVEHVLGQLAAGDDFETLLEGYPWLEREDILACLAYAHRLVGHERFEPLTVAKVA